MYDFGTLADGRFYLSTEYADGRNLRTLIERHGPMPMTVAIPLLSQLASAVAHAHSRGVIHRDLKPENLILEKDHRGRDVLKVLDFGIAKIVAPDYKDSVEITKYGSIQGTPHYMSPEQVRSEGNDPRSDIYAIGCLAFELAVGVPPFRGASAMDVMHSQVYDQPPRLEKQRATDTIPDEYEDIVDKCLAKSADERFQSGGELVDALERIPGYSNVAEGGATRQYARISQTLLRKRPSQMDTAHFDDEEKTVEHSPVGHLQTHPLNPIDARSEAALDREMTAATLTIELSEALLTLGADDDSRLSIQLCLVQEMRSELEQVVDEIEELEQRRTQVEQRAKHSEASVRFSIGELRFELERAQKEENRSIEARVTPHINALERRLAQTDHDLQRQLHEITTRTTFLEQMCMAREQDLERALGELQRLAVTISNEYTGLPHIANLLAALPETGDGNDGEQDAPKA